VGLYREINILRVGTGSHIAFSGDLLKELEKGGIPSDYFPMDRLDTAHRKRRSTAPLSRERGGGALNEACHVKGRVYHLQSSPKRLEKYKEEGELGVVEVHGAKMVAK